MHELIDYLTAKCNQLPAGKRFMVGLVGFPGAGKSTLSGRLVEGFNKRAGNAVHAAMVVPMDGFHLSNKVLDDKGLRPLKGVPGTFDAQAFVSLLQELRKEPPARVGCPCFDRVIDEPTPDAITVEPHHRLLVVEGNYLLLPEAPWSKIPQLLDEIWYIDSDFDTILPRLVQRHVLGGRTEEGAKTKVESTDLPNARLIQSTKCFADKVVRVNQEEACFSASKTV